MALLKVDGLDKRFGGLKALSQVSLEVGRGEIRGLIGPNGSGKTTFFNVVSGIYGSDGGRVEFKGQEITSSPAHEVNRLGMARTFQEIQLFYDQTGFTKPVLRSRLGKRNPPVTAFMGDHQGNEVFSDSLLQFPFPPAPLPLGGEVRVRGY